MRLPVFIWVFIHSLLMVMSWTESWMPDMVKAVKKETLNLTLYFLIFSERRDFGGHSLPSKLWFKSGL